MIVVYSLPTAMPRKAQSTKTKKGRSFPLIDMESGDEFRS